MPSPEKVNILLVDDQPAKLLSYEAVLAELGETLIKAASAREALEHLLKTDIAVILVDVCMPDLDGFQLAALIRDHPRFQKTAIIFISAVQLADVDRMRGYEMGAVDYVPVPVIPQVLRAKVKVFAELYRKTRQLEELNRQLERRVAERTIELEAAAARLQLALAAGRLGTWDWDLDSGEVVWSDAHYAMLGYIPGRIVPSYEALVARVHPDDVPGLNREVEASRTLGAPFHCVFRARHPNDTIVWCDARGTCKLDARGKPVRMIGVMMDVTEHKESEERQRLMVRELHHRVKNTLATVQAIAGFTARTACDIATFRSSFADRIVSLSKSHTLLVTNNWDRIELRELLDSELGSFNDGKGARIRLSGVRVDLPSDIALSLGMTFHELTTNAAKYGALLKPDGRIEVSWTLDRNGAGKKLNIEWVELGGPPVEKPARKGFGSQLIEKVIAGQLGAQVSVRYPRKGFRLSISLPWIEAASLTGPQHDWRLPPPHVGDEVPLVAAPVQPAAAAVVPSSSPRQAVS